MEYLFYERSGLASSDLLRAALPAGYEARVWRPSWRRPTPPECSAAYWAWYAFHRGGVFKNDGYSVVMVFAGDRLVHRCGVFPPYFRFPFMGDHDLQLGDIWTHPDHRSKGLAAFAGAQALALSPEHRYWYLCEETNQASSFLALRLGYRFVGRGVRSSRFGIRAMGAYELNRGEQRQAA
jgi:RimJ/RimL family protein N-acetyltransferase